MRKAGIALAGMLLLLVFMVWVPVSAANAHEVTSGLATPGTVTVQATLTEDATVATLNKEKLAQEVQQLKGQNEFSWSFLLRTNAAILLSTLVVVIGGLIGFFRWFGDRRSEREKQAEERFQFAVTGLGDEKEGAKIGAAILLRTFLRPRYEQFYTQTFDLIVANLRLPRTPKLSENPDAPLSLTTLSQALIVVFKEAFPLARKWEKKRRTVESSFLQRIKSRLPLSRRPIEEWLALQSLDATGIQLDNAYLSEADLEQIIMPAASLRKADLSRTNLSGAILAEANLSGAILAEANLSKAFLIEANLSRAILAEANLSEAWLSRANLSEANLSEANLSEAILVEAKLSKADLRWAKLSKAILDGADLSGAKLSGADLSGARLWGRGADLRGADLSGAKLSKVDLRGADLSGAILVEANLSEADLSKARLWGADLSEADLSRAKLSGADLFKADLSRAILSRAILSDANLSGADLSGAVLSETIFGGVLVSEDTKFAGVEGLTKEQLEAYKARGWLIDVDSTTSPSQPFVSPSQQPSQSNEAQAPSATPAQGSAPTPDTGGSSAPSSQQSSDTQAPPAPSAQESNPTPGTEESSSTPSQRGPES